MLLHKPSRKGSSIAAIMIRNARRYEHMPASSANRGDSSSGEINVRVRNICTRGHRPRCPLRQHATFPAGNLCTRGHRGRCPSNLFRVATRDITGAKHLYPRAPRPVPLQFIPCRNPRHNRRETFVPVGTEAGAPPIYSVSQPAT